MPTQNSIYRSTDGGNNWDKIKNKHMGDITRNMI